VSDELDLLQGHPPLSIKRDFAWRNNRFQFVAQQVTPTQWEGFMRDKSLLELAILVIKVMILVAEIMLLR